MTDYDHPSGRTAERLGIEAERAERRKDLRSKFSFSRLAAEYEAEAARAASDKNHKALIWSSAVAYAYHANDPALFQRLAAEALSSSDDSFMKREIVAMLEDPPNVVLLDSTPVQSSTGATVVAFSGLRTRGKAMKERVAA